MGSHICSPVLTALVLSSLFAASLAWSEATEPVTSGGAAGEMLEQQVNASKSRRLTADDTIGDLLNHPAFAGFGRLLLPWDDRRYDNGMRLRDVGSLLPYHSYVDPGTVVNALNHMIDDVNTGRAVFYEFYSAKEKEEQPAKSKTALFFFRGKPGAPFAVIAPGGGFSYVGSVHEGFPYAVAISNQGYNAFVLRYRAGTGGEVATRDLAAALSFVFRNGKTLGVGTDDHTALLLGNEHNYLRIVQLTREERSVQLRSASGRG